MKVFYQFKQNESEQIIKHFGNVFYEKVLRDIRLYADKWALSSFKFIPSYSANIVFTCFSEIYGSTVLKIGKSSSRDVLTEFNTLKEYETSPFCKVFDADIENGVILEEFIEPGIPLRNERSLDVRLSVFCSLYKDLHIMPVNAELYPTYTEWVSRITEYISRREDCKELALYMNKAEEICLSLTSLYPEKVLLHGDFHHDNILLGKDGTYKIIDPKGVIGNPIFDIPRFILNEFDDELMMETYKKINDIIGYLEKKLMIPNNIIRECLFVETAMGICWCVEDGATPEEYPGLVKTVAFAEAILKNE